MDPGGPLKENQKGWFMGVIPFLIPCKERVSCSYGEWVLKSWAFE